MRENKTYDELKVGDKATIKRVCTGNDLYIFAHASGNLNPLHMPEPTPDGEDSREKIAPSMWVGALVSGVLGNILPGPGTLYRSQSFQFLDRVHLGDELTVTVEVLEKLENNLVKFSTRVTGRGSDVIAEGEAQVYAPTQKMRVETTEVPVLEIRSHQHSRRLLNACKGLSPLRTVVVIPEEKTALGGALLAAEKGLITPVFVGSEVAIRQIAGKLRLDLSGIEIHDLPRVEDAANHAAELPGKRQVDAIMKGALQRISSCMPSSVLATASLAVAAFLTYSHSTCRALTTY